MKSTVGAIVLLVIVMVIVILMIVVMSSPSLQYSGNHHAQVGSDFSIEFTSRIAVFGPLNHD